MRHRKHTFKIGRTSGHRKALLANAVCSLIEQLKIFFGAIVQSGVDSNALFHKNRSPLSRLMYNEAFRKSFY